MNIQQAKEEIKNTVKAYLTKNAYGEYQITNINQRPLLLIGPPGIGKTQIMAQIAKECKIGLVSYTITHHTRQSAVGLPYIKEEEFEGKSYSITEYTMSEIIASIYQKMKETGLKHLLQLCYSSFKIKLLVIKKYLKDGSSSQRETHLNTISQFVNLIWSHLIVCVISM